jgi:N-acetylmuramoyl-L-alanine amidase
MRSFCQFLSLLVVSLVVMWTPQLQARSFGTVVIDAGHGAQDFGCHDGWLQEKHLALDMSRRLERYLRKKGVSTVMTRASDRFIPLETRAAIANGISNSVFVSIHVNDASRTGASGLETFYHNPAGQTLAGLVHSKMLSYTNNGGNRGVKFARFKVLRRSTVPGILVETGFISNSGDHSRLRDPAYREAIAQAIGDGLLAYR